MTKLNIIIIKIYQPPSGDIQGFFQILDSIWNELKKFTRAKILLSGDFNTDLNRTCNQRTNFLDLLKTYNLYPTIIHPTC